MAAFCYKLLGLVTYKYLMTFIRRRWTGGDVPNFLAEKSAFPYQAGIPHAWCLSTFRQK